MIQFAADEKNNASQPERAGENYFSEVQQRNGSYERVKSLGRLCQRPYIPLYQSTETSPFCH